MLNATHIHKSFQQQSVLKDVSLQVNQGDVIVILGPSGSGKTTFLRCLNGLEKADSGELSLADNAYDLAKISNKEILTLRKKLPLFFNTTICLPIKPLWKMS